MALSHRAYPKSVRLLKKAPFIVSLQCEHLNVATPRKRSVPHSNDMSTSTNRRFQAMKLKSLLASTDHTRWSKVSSSSKSGLRFSLLSSSSTVPFKCETCLKTTSGQTRAVEPGCGTGAGGLNLISVVRTILRTSRRDIELKDGFQTANLREVQMTGEPNAFMRHRQSRRVAGLARRRTLFEAAFVESRRTSCLLTATLRSAI